MENNMTRPKYRRVLLKLSGEALANGGDDILDFDFIHRVAEVVKKCHEAGVQIGVLCGAGNIWRGRQGGKIAIVKFYRFEKGEGIQKREENFAEEIAKMTAGK